MKTIMLAVAALVLVACGDDDCALPKPEWIGDGRVDGDGIERECVGADFDYQPERVGECAWLCVSYGDRCGVGVVLEWDGYNPDRIEVVPGECD